MSKFHCPTCNNRKKANRAQCGACKSAQRAINLGDLDRARRFHNLPVLPDKDIAGATCINGIQYKFEESENSGLLLPTGFETGDLKAEYEDFVIRGLNDPIDADECIDDPKVAVNFSIVIAED